MNAYVLGAKSAMEEWRKHPKRASILSLLHTLHQKATAAVEAASQLPVKPEGLEVHRSLLCTVGKHMALRLPEYSHLMLPYIEQTKAEGRCKAGAWVVIGKMCATMARNPLLPAAKAAWRIGLQLMRSQEEPPNMYLYAQTVMLLYGSSSEEEALTLLAEISDFLRSMEAPSYPRGHMEQLIRTVWDQGCQQAEAGRHSEALAFMAAALNLMDFSEDYKNGKEEYNRLYEETLEEAEL